MPDEISPGLDSVWKDLRQKGEAIARHDEAIRTLRESTTRLEGAVADLRGEMREVRQELKGEMTRGFDRLSADIQEINARAFDSYTPEAAQTLATTKAAEGRARTWATTLASVLVILLGTLAALLTRR